MDVSGRRPKQRGEWGGAGRGRAGGPTQGRGALRAPGWQAGSTHCGDCAGGGGASCPPGAHVPPRLPSPRAAWGPSLQPGARGVSAGHSVPDQDTEAPGPSGPRDPLCPCGVTGKALVGSWVRCPHSAPSGWRTRQPSPASLLVNEQLATASRLARALPGARGRTVEGMAML